MKAPKIAKAIADLVGIARKETDTAKIEAALVDARGQIEDATRDRENAEAAYRDSLLDAPETELEKRLAEKAAATVRLDQAEALTAALVQRLGIARAAEAQAARQAIHDDAVVKCEAIKARFSAEYQHHAEALRGLLHGLAEAETARAYAQKVASDIGYIEPPEVAMRRLSRKPEEIVDTEVVELWAIDGRSEPLQPDQAERVKTFDGRSQRGSLTIPSSGNFTTSGSFDCSKRSFRKVTYRPAETSMCVESLFRTLALPPVEDGAGAYYEPSEWQDAAGALTQLCGDVAPAPRRDVERPTLVRWEQVVQPHPSAVPPSNAVRLVGPGRDNLMDVA